MIADPTRFFGMIGTDLSFTPNKTIRRTNRMALFKKKKPKTAEPIEEPEELPEPISIEPPEPPKNVVEQAKRGRPRKKTRETRPIHAQEPKDDDLTFLLTREEAEIKILDLENDEDLRLFLKVSRGQRKYEELRNLKEALE
jgi:hypothetical protein